MKKAANSRKASFLADIKDSLRPSAIGICRDRISFSFQFLDVAQKSSIDFCDLSQEQLVRLCNKLKAYCQESLEHWKRTRIGGANNHVLEIYSEFPERSDFFPPTHIPHEVLWGRFRLEGDFRIAGFILGDKIASELNLSKNCFYIVFIDPNHRFYLTK